MELLLENAVDKLYLLLLVELHAVLRLLAASLLGLALGRLGVTKYRRGKTKRLATLENGWVFLAIYWFPPSIIRDDASAGGSRCAGSGLRP